MQLTCGPLGGWRSPTICQKWQKSKDGGKNIFMHKTLTTYRNELLALFSRLFLAFFCPGLKSEDAKKCLRTNCPPEISPKLVQSGQKCIFMRTESDLDWSQKWAPCGSICFFQCTGRPPSLGAPSNKEPPLHWHQVISTYLAAQGPMQLQQKHEKMATVGQTQIYGLSMEG